MKHDRITIETKKIFELRNKSKFYNPEIKKYNGFIFEGSKKEFPRMLKIIDSFVKNSHENGYKFIFQEGKAIININGIEIELRFREKNRRVKYERKDGLILN